MIKQVWTFQFYVNSLKLVCLYIHKIQKKEKFTDLVSFWVISHSVSILLLKIILFIQQGNVENALLSVPNNPGVTVFNYFCKGLESHCNGTQTLSFIVAVFSLSPFLPPTLLASSIQSPRAGNVSQKMQEEVTNYIYSSGFPVLSKRLKVILPQTWSRIS